MDSEDEDIYADKVPAKVVPKVYEYDLECLLESKSIEKCEVPQEENQNATVLKLLIEDKRTKKELELPWIPDIDREMISTMTGDYSEIEDVMYDIDGTDGTLMKLTLVAGTGDLLKDGDVVDIHFVIGCEFLDDLVESTYALRHPRRVRVGSGHVIPAMDMGLLYMRVGGLTKFLCTTSKLGFGEMSVPLRTHRFVPQQARLMIQIQVMDRVEAKNDKKVLLMTSAERRKLIFQDLYWYADGVKEFANREFKNNKYGRARNAYLEVLDCILDMAPLVEDELTKYWLLRRQVNTNLAITYYRLHKYSASLMYAEQATNLPILEKDKLKAYYWCAKALCGRRDFRESLEYIFKATKIGESFRDIKNLVSLIKDKIEEKKKAEEERIEAKKKEEELVVKELYKRMSKIILWDKE